MNFQKKQDILKSISPPEDPGIIKDNLPLYENIVEELFSGVEKSKLKNK